MEQGNFVTFKEHEIRANLTHRKTLNELHFHKICLSCLSWDQKAKAVETTKTITTVSPFSSFSLLALFSSPILS